MAADAADAEWLKLRAAELRSELAAAEKREAALDGRLAELMAASGPAPHTTELDRPLEIVVDPVRARFSAWYEMFPRSASRVEGAHGTFADCIERLPYVASMGFDVLYLPPVHPIGRQFRKGANNSTDHLDAGVLEALDGGVELLQGMELGLGQEQGGAGLAGEDHGVGHGKHGGRVDDDRSKCFERATRIRFFREML